MIGATDSIRRHGAHPGISAADAEDTATKPSPPSDPVVTVRSLSKRYGKLVALEEIGRAHV